MPDIKREEVSFWSVERLGPQEAFLNGRKIQITGVQFEMPVSDNFKATDIVSYTKNNCGGGDYIAYGINDSGEMLVNRPFSIPSFFPLKIEGQELQVNPESPER